MLCTVLTDRWTKKVISIIFVSVDYMKSLDVANLLNEGYWEGPYLWGDYYKLLDNHNHLLVDDNDQEKKGKKRHLIAI